MLTEKRFHAGLEIRKSGGDPPRLVGYAAVFDSPSQVLYPGFVEIIRRGAFSRTLRERKDNIFAFVDHDPGRVIGRRGKNVTLDEDAHGLRVEIVPIDSPEGQGVVRNVEAGILDSMSFAFTVHGAEGEKPDSSVRPPRRELLDVDLYEVSIVAMPAYVDTSIAVRSLPGLVALAPTVAELRAKAEARAAGWRG